MPQELIVPSALMTLALVLYSAGVWSERAQRDLRAWHTALFWAGLACDGTATWMMEQLTDGPRDWFSVHGVTGLAAFLLMAVHAAWASWTVRRGTPEARATFHRYSVAVWLLWLVPYLNGMVVGMMRAR